MEDKKNGSVKISEEVVASIVTTAAMETEGVARVYQKLQPATKAAVPASKHVIKGVVITTLNDGVDLTVQLEVKLGYKIPDVANAVQKHVADSVRSMTGLNVLHVNAVVLSVVDPSKIEGAQ
ncbi:MAG: Asp23/Gls24 family envelope stress response protein [Eubacteriales bacterium]